MFRKKRYFIYFRNALLRFTSTSKKMRAKHVRKGGTCRRGVWVYVLDWILSILASSSSILWLQLIHLLTYPLICNSWQLEFSTLFWELFMHVVDIYCYLAASWFQSSTSQAVSWLHSLRVAAGWLSRKNSTQIFGFCSGRNLGQKVANSHLYWQNSGPF